MFALYRSLLPNFSFITHNLFSRYNNCPVSIPNVVNCLRAQSLINPNDQRALFNLNKTKMLSSLEHQTFPHLQLTLMATQRYFYSAKHEVESLKKLPIGVQSFEKLIEGNYLYVDKTRDIFRLINEGQHYFLSRPTRFGKSLFLSTLRAIFNGQKELFKGCYIYSADYSWLPHPIVHLDFTQIPTHSTQDLKDGIGRSLQEIAKSYGEIIEAPSLQEALRELVIKLSKNVRVVVLVDECNKPLIDNISDIKLAKDNQKLLTDFFGTLKGLDSNLRFVFVTSDNKFAQVSLFSGLNNLRDLTFHPEYATIAGYTEAEIEYYFKDRLEQLAVKTGYSKDYHAKEMREWYNGYRFSWGKSSVYNPHSTLNFLDTGRIQKYWSQTGTPSFLIDQVRKHPESVTRLSGAISGENELFDIDLGEDFEKLELKTLMWQTGYLTIRSYDQETNLYQLDFPNKELRRAFFDTLLNKFAGIDAAVANRLNLDSRAQLEKCDLEPFMNTIKAFFAKIPYNLLHNGSEGVYHAIFLSLMEAMGIKVQAEEKINISRIDLVVEMKKYIYVIEFKFNKTAQEALDQIELKRYKEKFSTDKKIIVAVGINFDSNIRNVSDWQFYLDSMH